MKDMAEILRKLQMRHDADPRAQAKAERVKQRNRFAGEVESAGNGSRDVSKDEAALAAIEKVLSGERISETKQPIERNYGKLVRGRLKPKA